MKRRILIALLTVGTVGGYALGFHEAACHGRARRAAFENHVAQVCVDAARRTKGAEVP